MVAQSEDAELRREAMAWLTVRTNDGAEPISRDTLEDFTFHGQRVRLLDRMRGITRVPRLAAALSIMTAPPRSGRSAPYDDELGSDGFLRYKWQGTVATAPDNVALRAAMTGGVPLIWFQGVVPGIYLPVFPVFLIEEEPAGTQFVVDTAAMPGLVKPSSVVEENLRRYVLRQTRSRVHQPRFRAQVIYAYDTRCAVCALHHAELLDAAHIVPDSAEAGIARISNGMAMCKIHHAAYDRHILGVRPDLVVEIRADLLAEVDGPMLKHGLVERHGQPLMAVPTRRADRPDAGLLQVSYDLFRAAG